MAGFKQRSVLSKLAILSVAGLVLGLIVVVGMYYSARARLNGRLNALATAGMPTTGSELNDFYKVPADQPDTTQLWLEACKAVSTPEFNDATKTLPIIGIADDIPPMGEEWTAQAETASTLKTAVPGELAAVRKAAEMGGKVRFPVDFRQGYNTILSNTQQLRVVARLLQLDAHIAARQGDSQRVLDDIQGLLAASEALAMEPILVSQLVRYAIHNMAVITTEKLVPHCQFSDQQLLELQAHLMRADLRDGFKRALIGERAICVKAIGKASVPFGTDNQLIALDIFEAAIETMDKSGISINEWQEQEEARFNALSVSSISKFRHRGVLLTIPAIPNAADAVLRSDARRRCAVLAVAAQRKKLRDGSYPVGLPAAEFLGVHMDASEDPYNGRKMLVVEDGASLTYYSVGKNEADDGGSVNLDAHAPLDCGLRLPKLPAQKDASPAGSAVLK